MCVVEWLVGTKKVMTAMKDNCDGVGRRSVRLLYDLDGWPAVVVGTRVLQ